MSLRFYKLVWLYFLVISIKAGRKLEEEAKKNIILVLFLQNNGDKIYICDKMLMGFLNCVSGVDFGPCVLKTQPSSSSVSYLVTDKQSQKENIITDMHSPNEIIKTDKQSQNQNITTDKQSQNENITIEKQSLKENISTDKQSQNENITTEKQSQNENISTDKQSQNENLTTDNQSQKENNQTHISVNCSLNRVNIIPSLSYYNITCSRGEPICDTIKLTSTQAPNNNIRSFKTFQISWQQPISVTLINDSFLSISIDKCNTDSANISLLIVSISIIVTIFLMSIAFVMFKRKRNTLLRNFNSYDGQYEEIDSNVYYNLPSRETVSKNHNNEKCVFYTENDNSIYSLRVNTMDQRGFDNKECPEDVQNNLSEEDKNKAKYYVLELETE